MDISVFSNILERERQELSKKHPQIPYNPVSYWNTLVSAHSWSGTDITSFFKLLRTVMDDHPGIPCDALIPKENYSTHSRKKAMQAVVHVIKLQEIRPLFAESEEEFLSYLRILEDTAREYGRLAKQQARAAAPRPPQPDDDNESLASDHDDQVAAIAAPPVPPAAPAPPPVAPAAPAPPPAPAPTPAFDRFQELKQELRATKDLLRAKEELVFQLMKQQLDAAIAREKEARQQLYDVLIHLHVKP